MALKDDVEGWQKSKDMGIRLGDYESDCLTNLCFADDVLLFPTSLVQLQKMMCDIKHSTETVGLKIHPNKTNIPSNQSTNRRKEVQINNIKVEISSACECEVSWANNYISATRNSKIKNRIRAAWESFYRIKQELTSRSYFLPNRLRLLNMPTLSYASGTWTLSKEHERMIRSTQRKMLRLVVQAKRKSKKKNQPSKNDEDEEDKNTNHRSSDDETAEGSSSNTRCDQDRYIFFTEDTDEEIDTGEIEEEEDRIEHMERSTATAAERMKAAKIQCWIETHRRMKWRLAMKIASLPDKRWAKKAAKWNLGLRNHAPEKQTSGKTRKKERWEGEIHDFLKRQETEETKGNEIQKQRHLDKSGKNRERWRAMESEYAETAATASVDSVHSRRNPPKDPVRPVRYLNGVKLEEYEVANIALPHTKDQYDLDDTAADTAYEARNKTKHQRIEAWKRLLSSNHLDDRVCRTFP